MSVFTRPIHTAATFLAFSVIAFGCAGQPSGDSNPQPPANRVDGGIEGVTLTITTSDVEVGGEVEFTFTNGSDDTLTTGALDCVNHYERRDGDRWIRVEAFRACIMLAQIHAPGSSSKHRTPAPEQPGRYRLVVQAGAEGDTEPLVIRSAEFEVD